MKETMLLFLRHVLPSQGTYCAVAYKRKKVVAQYFVNSIEELANKLINIDSSGLTAFFACSSYPLGCQERKQEKALFMRAFWGDLDVDPENPEKYATQEEAIRDLLRWCKLRNLPWPTIVSSGYGIHFYWVLTEDIVKLKWKPVAERLKQQMLMDGIKLDKSRTADPASVLRPVGAFNKKRKNQPKPVKILGNGQVAPAIDFQLMASVLNVQVMPDFIKGIPTQEFIDLGNMGNYDGPPSDADVMAQKCMVMGNAKALQGKVDYTYWWLMIGALHYCKDGDKLAHEWSKGHHEYSQRDVDFKISEWNKTSGPPTCERISHDLPNICSTCPHFGEVTTPVRLGVVYEELEPVTLDTGIEVPMPVGFKRTKHGLTRASGSDDVDDICFYDRDLYIKDIIKSAQGYHEAVVAWDKPLEGQSEFNVRTSDFTDTRLLAKIFADEGIFLIGRHNTEHMMIYATSYLANLQKKKKAISGHINMGWKPDGTFVLGNSVIDSDGTVTTNSAVSHGIEAAKDIHTSGTLEEWKKAMEVLADPHMYRHAFALMCGFAGPLMQFTGIDGAMVNLVGQTGAGKSSMQRAINSLVGNPKKLLINAKDTEKAKLGRMGQLSSITTCIDEMGNERAETLSDLILKVTQGSDVRRLSQSGTERSTKEWCTVIVTSSNHTFHSKLNHYKGNPDAEKMRLFEYVVKDTDVFRDKESAARFNRAVLRNYGHAGLEYIKHLVQIGDKLPDIIDMCRDKLPSLGINFKPRERYWEATFVCAMAGGIIAKKLGLISFDPLQVISRMAQEVKYLQTKISTERFNPLDLLADYMQSNIRNIIQVDYADGTPDFNRMQYNVNALVGRAEIRKYGGQVASAELYLSKTPFVDYLVKRYLDFNEFVDSMAELGVVVNNERKQLATSADLGSFRDSRANVLVFNLLDSKLGISLDNMQAAATQDSRDENLHYEPDKNIH